MCCRDRPFFHSSPNHSNPSCRHRARKHLGYSRKGLNVDLLVQYHVVVRRHDWVTLINSLQLDCQLTNTAVQRSNKVRGATQHRNHGQYGYSIVPHGWVIAGGPSGGQWIWQGQREAHDRP
eukprot:scaffold2083_cov419-Prasinococcus_capsulatus_cf.AAC.10